MADDPSKTLDDRILQIKAKYAPQIKALQDEGQQIEDDTEKMIQISPARLAAQSELTLKLTGKTKK
jgi:hypothetical protein